MKKLLLIIVLIYFQSATFAQNIYLEDSLTFEELPVTGLTVYADSNNQWQIGKPTKNIFQNTISGNSCIVTDTVNTYIPGNKSIFLLEPAIYLSTFPGYFIINFDYSINTDSLAGGYIELSYDSIKWFNIFQFDSISYNWGASVQIYTQEIDTLFNNQKGFTGNDTNKNFQFGFGGFPFLRDFWGDNPYLRFTFISDSLSTPSDGWMLDNFYIGQVESEGSVSESLSKSITLYPNPSIDKLAIDVGEKTFKPTNYSITNITGQEIRKGNLTGRVIDVATFPQGSYFITLTDAKGNSGVKMFYKE